MYTVYVLFSESTRKTYIGMTSDLLNRFKSHNELGTKGYTKNYRPWKVIHIEYFTSKSEALVRERQLKSGNGRGFIKERIIPKMLELGFLKI